MSELGRQQLVTRANHAHGDLEALFNAAYEANTDVQASVVGYLIDLSIALAAVKERVERGLELTRPGIVARLRNALFPDR